MSKKKATYVLDLCEKDETRYIWKHVWMKRKDGIQSDLRNKGITIYEDPQSLPFFIPDTLSLDNFFILISRIFNENASDIKATCHVIESGVNSEEVEKISIQLSTDDVGIYKGNQNEWWFVGSVKRFDDVIESFDNTVASMVRDKSGTKQTDNKIDETFEEVPDPVYIHLTEREKAIMLLYGLLKIDCLQESNVDIRYKRFDFRVSVSDKSTKDMIEKDLRVKIDSFKDKIALKFISFSERVYKFILKDAVHEFVKSKNVFMGKPDCVWFEGSQNVLHVYAKDVDTVERKSKIIQNAIKEESVAVPPRFFKTDEAVQKLSDLENRQNGKLSLQLSASCSTVNIMCTSDISSSKTSVELLFCERKISVSTRNQSICERFFRKNKSALEEQLAVDISEISDRYNYRWSIAGGESKVKVAYEKLNKLQSSLSFEAKSFICDESMDTVKSKLNNIADNSSCVVDTMTDTEAIKAADVADLRLSIPCRSLQMVDGHHITIYKCSLKQNPWLMKKCLVVKTLSVSDMTSSAEFNFRPDNENNCYQALLYLPDWEKNVNKEKHKLERVMGELMTFTKDNKKDFMSLVFDLAEINKLQWPGNQYLKGILYAIQTNKPAIDVHIHQYSEDKYEKASNQIYDWCTGETEKVKPDLQIHVVKGELARQKSDILVNSTNGTLQLKQGVVSGSLLRVAGEDMQKDCDRYLSSQKKAAIYYTEVVKTPGYNLSCKYVFHGTLPHWGGNKDQQSTACIIKFIQNCLTEAVALNVESIAFPALGAGNLKYPADVSAKLMFDVVEQFAASGKASTLRDVQFVIYPGDEKVVKAFECEETRRNAKGLQWNEAVVANSDCLATKVTVIGEDANSIQQIFNQIYDVLKRKEKANEEPQTQFVGGVTSEREYFDKEPQIQTMIRGETPEANDGTADKPKQEAVDQSSYDFQRQENMLATAKVNDKQKAPPTPPPDKISEPFFVDVDIIKEDGNLSPYEMLISTFNKYGVTDDQVVWCPNTPFRARLKIQMPTGASNLIDKMKDEKSFKLQKSSLDAVVNIRAKLNNAFTKILQDKCVRVQLRKQSGVNISDEYGDSVILTGDLTAIGTARELLMTWNREKSSPNKDGISFVDDPTKSGKYDKANDRHGYSETIVSDTSEMKKRIEQETNESLRVSFDTQKHTTSTRNDTEFPYSTYDLTSKKNNTREQGTPERTHGHNLDNSNIDPWEHGKDTSVPGMTGDINQTFSNNKEQGAIPKQIIRQQSKTEITGNRGPKNQNVNGSKNISAVDKYNIPEESTKTGNVSNIYPNLRDVEKSLEKETKPNVMITRSKFIQPNEEFVMMITKEGVKILVYKADICFLRVNGIVNSTNSGMTNMYGMSKAILKNAGDGMQHQCQQYLLKYYKLEKDKVCVTHAGNLSHYNFILHVSAPKWDDKKNDKQFATDLSKAVQICLTEANRIGGPTIALPAISSGYGGAPEKITFKAYPNGVLKFCEENAKNLAIKEIHFVDINQDVVDHVRAAFLATIPEPSSNFIDKLMRIPKQIREKFVSNIRAEDQAGKSIELHLPENNFVIVVCDGSLTSSLKHPHIQELLRKFGYKETKYTETAVVITEDRNFNGKSKSSQKCAERSGDSYSKNYNSLKKMNKRKQVGEVLDFLGDEQLDFYYVLCTIMPKLNEKVKEKNSKEQTYFFQKINECCGNVLKACDQFGVTHLSLPVLCPDFYDYSAEWFWRCCASNMISEIKEFAMHRIQKQFMIIHIVTNGNDNIFKMFRGLMKTGSKKMESRV